MNLISLYYFTELAKELHVTKTAQNLYISQQNLSQHIQRLEQYYGVSLFHRKPKLALTYAGEQLYQTALKILFEETELTNRLSSISTTHSGSLKVGIPAYRGQICLPQILPRFYEKWPNIHIQLVQESSGKMEEMLNNGELDFFIGIMYHDDAKLNITTVLNDRIFLVCSDELLKKHVPDRFEFLKKETEQRINLKWFNTMPFLLPKAPMKLRSIIDSCFAEAKVTPNIFLESSTTELLISLYPYHFGAFFCTQMRLPLLIQTAPSANMFPLLLNNEFVQHRLVLAYHKERFLTPYAVDFIEITKEVFHNISTLRIQ